MSTILPSCNLPYADLNLRRNPFGEFSEQERTSLAVVNIDDVVRRLAEPGFVVQYVGEKGYGKTTHLLAIRARFAAAGYVHLPEDETAKIPTGSPLLIDEAQRMTFWQRLRTFRSKVPLVLGTHRDFTRELLLAGRTVETIEVQQGTSIDRLHELLNGRISWVRRSASPVPTITRSTVERLHVRHGSDIRSMLHELYDVFQKLNEVRHV